MMTFLSSPDHGYEMYGFDRAEFEYFLLCQGKAIDGVELASVAQPVPVQIEWARELIGIPGFTIKEAAALICGLDPFDRGWGTDDESRKLDIALRLLNAALDRGDLSRVGQDEGGNPLLNADDLRCWCPTVDRVWPIPDATGKVHGMATDTELLAMLRESEQRAVAAEARLRAAGELADTTKELRKQIVGLMADVARLEAEKRQAENNANTLNTEIAEGKGKSSMLRLIGGLAMTGHGMDIHATRLNGISEMISDLAEVGVHFTEPTIRKLLKDAANLIEPKTEPNQK